MGLALLSATCAGCSSDRQRPSARVETAQAVASTPSSSSQGIEVGVARQPATPVSLGQPSPLGKAQAYTREVEGANYLVAQHKSSRVGVRPAPAPGYGGVYDSSPSPAGQPSPGHPDELYQLAMAVPLSTFSADVDTASYANVRRSLLEGRRPDPDSVRVEEMLNYFSYDLPEPARGEPFSVTSELSDCPWSSHSKLLRLAIKTRSIDVSQRPPCNLVFLLDVSGSMSSADKLPLLKSSLKTLLDNLDDADRIAIVTYAGNSGLALPSTPASDRVKILAAIDRLESGGSTNGASGIQLAYQVAKQAGSEGSVNRVILCTDGDFNVGISSPEALKTMIEEKRKSGLFLSVLGFGHGNDKVMETLADNGNGNYACIDSALEARKVLVEEAGATLVTVAKDVKFQIAFNPLLVERYRLLGYQNRRLAAQDFANDAKDAGDLGAGHAVTVLYEVTPPTSAVATAGKAFEEIRGRKPSGDQLAILKLRYKEPSDDVSELREIPVSSRAVPLDEATPDHRWAVAVTQFGLSLHGDPALRSVDMEQIAALAGGAMGQKGDDYRREFLRLVDLAKDKAS
jgi:Ca-activated chloride channel family protein